MIKPFQHHKFLGIFVLLPCCQDAVSIALGEEEPEAAARKLTETAFSRGSADNITCIVVRFRHDRTESPEPLLKQQKTSEVQEVSGKETEIPEDRGKESENDKDQTKVAEAPQQSEQKS